MSLLALARSALALDEDREDGLDGWTGYRKNGWIDVAEGGIRFGL